MADAFRGLTLRLGADARPLQSAISSITRSASQAQKQMNRLDKAMKFDGANVKMMASKLDLIGDKGAHSARAVQKIQTAMRQAVAEAKDFDLKKVAGQTQDAYSATQKLRDEYNHVDASLQHIYDAVGRVAKRAKELEKNDDVLAKLAMRMNKLSANDAVEYIKKLRKEIEKSGPAADEARYKIKDLVDNASLQDSIDYVKRLKERMKGTGDEADKAASEFKRLMEIASKESGINELFGQQKGDVQALINEMNTLISRHKKLNTEHNKMKTVQGYRSMQAEVEVFSAEVRKAAADAARLRTEMHSLGTGGSLRSNINSINRLSGVSEKAVASAHQMIDVYRAMPNSLERLEAKTLAVRTAEATLAAEAGKIRAALRKIEADPAFDKVAASSEKAYLEALKVENQYTDLTTEMKLAEAEADQLRQTLKSMSVKGGQEEADEYRRLTTALVKADNKVEKLKDNIAALDDSHATAALTVQQRELSDRLAKNISLAKDLHSQVSRLNGLATAGKGLRNFGFGMYASVTPAAMMLGRYMLQTAEDTDAAYRDMRKTVNGTEEEFEHLKDAAIEFSTTHVTTAEDILGIEAIGGQLGIQVENLEAFARTVSNLDIATNMDAEDIATDLGKMATVLGINEKQYDLFGDALVRLGNNMPVMENDIMNLTNRFMGMGKVVGMQPDEMLAWAAAASATGMKAEAAGSSMQRYISKMETAVVSGGEDLEAWAKVAGMSGEEFANLFNEDASSAMYEFVEGLGEIQKSGGSVNQTLMELGINNVRDKQLLEGLANQMANGTAESNTLSEALRMANDAYNGLSTDFGNGRIELAGDAMREAEKKSEGFSGAMGKMRNQAKSMLMELAEGAAPLVSDLGSLFGDLAKKFREMPDSMKTFVVECIAVAAAIGPVTVGLGTMLQSVAIIGKSMTRASGAIIKFGAAIGKLGPAGGMFDKLGTSVAALGTSAAAFPAAIAAIGIGALAYGIFDAYKKTQNFIKATDGAVEAAKKLASLGSGDGSIGEYGEKTEVAAKSNEELARRISEVTDANNERAESAEHDIGALMQAQEIIDKYANTDLSGNINAQAELKTAVEMVNDVCGTQWQIIDIVNGKLADERGQLLDTAGAVDEYIQKKIDATKADALTESLAAQWEVENDAMVTYFDNLKKQQDYYNEHQKGVEAGDKLGNWEYQEYAKLEEATNKAKEIWQSQSEASEIMEGQLENLVSTSESATSTVKNLAMGNSQLFALSQAGLLDLETFAANIEAAGITVDEFTSLSKDDIEAMAEAYVMGGNDIDAALQAVGLTARSLSEQYKAEMENASGSTDTWVAALERTQLAEDELATSLNQAGIGAVEFANMGASSFDALYTAANGDFNLIRQEIDLLEAGGLDLGSVTINDDGLLQVGDKVIELNGDLAMIDGQEYRISANGEGFEPVKADIEEVDAEAEEGAEYDVTGEFEGDDELYEYADEIEEIPEEVDTNLNINYDTEELQSVLGEMLSSGDMAVNATVNFESSGSEEVSSTWESLKSSVAEGAQGVLTFDTSSMEQAIEVSGNLKMAIENIPEARGIYITVVGDALSTISSIWWSLASLPTYKEIEIRTIHSSDGHAAGGVFTKFAAGGMIPSHAHGALNGIVRSATLTNIGWVGEAGAEAVMHMRNAGGAVVPLTNKRYVRPFARAVAYEAMDMGGYGMRGGDTYNTTINTTGSGDELARTLTGALNTYSRLHGRGRRR